MCDEPNKRNKFIHIVKICLSSDLCQYLYEHYPHRACQPRRNLLYCSKDLTSIIIHEIIRMKYIPQSIADKMPETHKKYIRHLTFDQKNYCDNDAHDVSMFSQIKAVAFDDMVVFEIKENTLPQNLTRLILGGRYNKPLTSGMLPSSLTELFFWVVF